ncbi:hypothetical protein TNCV_1944721 [Trichonephila clavipes]|nr:hypothetical protein TNCV_1944721 [Trichonephila clavipes]
MPFREKGLNKQINGWMGGYFGASSIEPRPSGLETDDLTNRLSTALLYVYIVILLEKFRRDWHGRLYLNQSEDVWLREDSFADENSSDKYLDGDEFSMLLMMIVVNILNYYQE